MSDDKRGMKRNVNPSELTGREKKRARNQESRRIETQIGRAPRTIDVVDFAEARSFEINAMQNAIRRAKEGAVQRAFQSLPRHLRRRAASHNVKRLPVRLREKALREMANDNTISKKGPSRRKKRRPGSIMDEYKRRQVNKRWLETHIWHSKRAKMVERWGYRLAEHPNEKSIRSSYKASSYLSLIHDASYFGCIQLSGSEKAITHVLNSLTDPNGPSVGGIRYNTGKRQCSTFLYRYMGYPSAAICPVTLIWRPVSQNSNKRFVWMWVHPSTYEESYEALLDAIEKLELSDDIEIEDLRDELVQFELTGPRTQALLDAVFSVSGESLNAEVWKKLSCLRSTSSLPPGCVLGLLVDDPRLQFPQKVPSRYEDTPQDKVDDLNHILNEWPDNVADSDIWNSETRRKLISEMISEEKLNQRRNDNLIPGTKLKPEIYDAKIPILLIQRNGLAFTTNSLSSPEWSNGWNLIIPSGWGMAFWKSFIFAGARFGGLRERDAMHFEAGLPCFPYDYPGTKAYREFSDKHKAKAEEMFNKKPPAKRPNYEKLKIEHPFEAPFHLLVGSKQPTSKDKLWILRGKKATSLLRGGFEESNLNTSFDIINKKLLENITNATETRGIKLEEVPDAQRAVVCVRIKMLDRGTPGSHSLIYVPSNTDYDAWEKHLSLKKQVEFSRENPVVPNTIPSSESIIGYVTNGRYSFTQGQGFAIGCCSTTGLHKLYQTRQRSLKQFVLIRGTTNMSCRPALLEILS
ncbi:POP1-domain-containing protein [Basidiobolus meristosporus CBS 931.73]|uniref:POP1-domain-containing protein n=1 Tax=Basidiobolus meristosporus CBS 931.73 TaxID=1314790 RepID=A0A1Y1YRW6_9FUNG|nr:POP1-domain-containing protein [Basidiobolus meristosporus CBS 931.73]|eukprot:ORY00772.1 POP1-domain-containing protein [Basidiobolus meristosporus CBS 931.73]